jgi:Amidohydrolase
MNHRSSEVRGSAVSVEDMIFISVDDHVVEPPGLFDGLLPAKYAERAPKVVRTDAGNDVWVFDGAEIPNIGLNAVAGRPREEYGVDPTSFEEMRPGCYDIDERVKDMSAGGVLACMCFPSFPSFSGRLYANVDDKDLALAVTRAYNNWHIDVWCGSHPGRMIPMALPILWDPELCAEEIRRVAAKGCHSLTFTENPAALGLPSFHSDHWDPMWRALVEEGTILNVHLGSSGLWVPETRPRPLTCGFATGCGRRGLPDTGHQPGCRDGLTAAVGRSGTRVPTAGGVAARSRCLVGVAAPAEPAQPERRSRPEGTTEPSAQQVAHRPSSGPRSSFRHPHAAPQQLEPEVARRGREDRQGQEDEGRGTPSALCDSWRGRRRRRLLRHVVTRSGTTTDSQVVPASPGCARPCPSPPGGVRAGRPARMTGAQRRLTWSSRTVAFR